MAPSQQNRPTHSSDGCIGTNDNTKLGVLRGKGNSTAATNHRNEPRVPVSENSSRDPTVAEWLAAQSGLALGAAGPEPEIADAQAVDDRAA